MEENKPQSTEIVPVPNVSLGSIAVQNPRDIVARATDYADVLAEIINKQGLYKVISTRKYVMCEGWTTLGAMLGVVPVEEYCRTLPDNAGFEAKINLIRTRDGAIIGGASAECTRSENSWKNRDSYALRSMSLTRATGKAFRLSFSWIMKLAGFEATPAEEMIAEDQGGSKEAALEIGKRKIAEYEQRKADATTPQGKATKPAEGKDDVPKANLGSPVPEPTGEGPLNDVRLAKSKTKGTNFLKLTQNGVPMRMFKNHEMNVNGEKVPVFDILLKSKGLPCVFQLKHDEQYGYQVIGALRIGDLRWDAETGEEYIQRDAGDEAKLWPKS